MKSDWYSGGYKISKGRELHYLLQESTGNKDKDPLIVAFNGGPGGPSTFLGFAALGSIVPGPSGQFEEYAGAWTRASSMLFLDNPAGVGYSYAKRRIDYPTSDLSAA